MRDAASTLSLRVGIRLVLPCGLLLLASSIDRANLSFAALQMNASLGLSHAAYGFGAGIFFVGYLVAQLPSILVYERIGMRRWASLVALLWGLAATGMAFIHSAAELYVLRILLGVAEAGLAAGIMLYLNQWTSERDRATVLAVPIAAIPISIVIAGPLSGVLLEMSNPMGLEGWRWMFLIEGLPTLLLGVAALFYFPDRPQEARWLSDDERRWIAENTLAETRRQGGQGTRWGIIKSPLTWLCGLLWFCLLAGNYGIIFWLPQAVGGLSDLSPVEVGAVVALPWIANVAGIYLNARHSDRTQERYLHIVAAAVLAAASLVAAYHLGSGWPALVALTFMGFGLGAGLAPYWAIPPRLVDRSALPIAIPIINIIGSSSGLLIPYLMGLARQASGSFAAPTYLLAGVVLLAASFALAARFHDSRSG